MKNVRVEKKENNMAKSKALPTFTQIMSKGNNEEHYHTGKNWANKIKDDKILSNPYFWVLSSMNKEEKK